MRIVDSKSLFINTESAILGSGNNFQINLPQAYLRCEEHQRIKIVLESFEMSPRCFFLANLTNTYFYLRHLGVLYPVKMPEGDFTATEILLNLRAEINAVLLTTPLAGIVHIAAAADVSLFVPTAEITIKISPVAPLIVNPAGNFLSIIFLGIYNFGGIAFGALPAILQPVQTYNNGINSTGLLQPTDVGFQDTHEAYGGIATTDPSNIKIGFQEAIVSASEYTLSSFFPAKLQTQENIYLRCSLPGNNLATKNYINDFAFSKRPDESEVLQTKVFAKIPIPIYNRTSETTYVPTQAITFLNPSDNFYINLQKRWLTTLEIALQDDKGRLIPAPNLTALQERYFQYSFTLAFQIIEDREAEILEAVSKQDP